MKTETKKNIIVYIKSHKKARPYDLIKEFGLSSIAIHKQLKRLVEEGILTKVGQPPLVFYVVNNNVKLSKIAINKSLKKIVNENYLYISPKGEIIEGVKGFSQWATNTNQNKYLNQLVLEYLKVRKQVYIHKTSEGWIDATKKIQQTFNQVFIDKLIFADFYSLPKFGKTRLGQFVLYAKQSQKRELINKLIEEIDPIIKKIIKKHSVGAVAFIPPTVPRLVQFVKELEIGLNIKLPKIDLVKVQSGDVSIAQKTLSKLEERIINAKETIYLKSQQEFRNTLLIDDAVGSGATFNETAKKLREEKLVKGKIIAFAIVGSYKGFDVIREI